jgi:hypothetical protein
MKALEKFLQFITGSGWEWGFPFPVIWSVVAWEWQVVLSVYSCQVLPQGLEKPGPQEELQEWLWNQGARSWVTLGRWALKIGAQLGHLTTQTSLDCLLKLTNNCQVLVAHACNPSYSGGRDQEDQGSKPAQANSLWDPILKKPITKKGWWSGSRCRPWV